MQLDIPSSAPESLADYHQHYGLASDPFSDDPEFPFFGGGQRRLLLEHLLEQTQSGSSLLAVLGPVGVGKTRMAHAFVQAFSGEQDLCHVKAQPGCRAEQILGDISRGFGITGTTSQSEGQILVGLRSFIQSSDDSDGLIMLVVDDAHHLDEQTLGALLSLLQGQGDGARRLHMIFFALPALVDHLDRFGMHDVPVYDLYLEPLSLAEATDYLNFRLEMADYLGPELFSEARVEPWWRQSAGDLTGLHDCAHQWLLASIMPAASPEPRSLPRVHIMAVSLLCGVLVVALLYRGGDDAPEPEPLVLEPRPRVLPQQPESISIQRSVPEVQPAPETPELVRPDVLAPPLTVAPPATVQPEAAPSIQSTSPTPQPAPVPTPLRPQLPEDEQVLLSWRASEYTLQILGSSSDQAVRDFIARQSNAERLLSFKSERQGKDWYVVVTGRYPNSESARAAIAGLPSEQRQAGPWARQLSGIQQEIEAVRGL